MDNVWQNLCYEFLTKLNFSILRNVCKNYYRSNAEMHKRIQLCYSLPTEKAENEFCHCVELCHSFFICQLNFSILKNYKSCPGLTKEYKYLIIIDRNLWIRFSTVSCIFCHCIYIWSCIEIVRKCSKVIYSICVILVSMF